MFESSYHILQRLDESDLVLDVGGWARPFERADWVLDLMPWETRGLYLYDRDAADERFTADTWVQRDICAREPWPFADDQFDFAICSHTLEDVRDPVWVCSELNRVARAGYIEVPSRIEEQSWNIHGPWVGWNHHHWFCDVSADGIEFVFKNHVIHGMPDAYLADGVHAGLPDDIRFSSLWWEDGFQYGERLVFDPDELMDYLRAGLDDAAVRGLPRGGDHGGRSVLSRAARRLRG